jgi:hypothetical protein
MKQQPDKFNFFVPLKFEKGSLGNKEMKFSGICSSAVEDSDEEVLFPSGFNFNPLMEKGYINWNHQGGKTAGAIIGRPTRAEVINNGKDFYIEGSLYKGVEEAKRVYELAKALEDEDPLRRLGFSIEGKAIERDIMNPKKILRAEITGVAITSSPKNPNTLLNIVKGNYSEQFVDDDTCPMCGHDNSGDTKCKCIDIKKTMTAEAGEGVTQKESVEHNPKDMVNKAEIYRQIIVKYDVDNIEKAKEIYNFIQQVNTNLFNMKEGEGVVSEGLKKAFDILDSQIALVKSASEEELVTGEAKTEEVIKSEESAEVTGETKTEEVIKSEEATEVVKSEEVVKGDDINDIEMSKAKGFAGEGIAKGMSRDECVEDLVRKGLSLTVSSTAVDTVISEAAAAPNGGTITADPGAWAVTVEKSIQALALQVAELTTKVGETLVKSEVTGELVTSTVDYSQITDLIKSQTDGLDLRFDSIGQILKVVVEDNALLKSSVEELILENGNLRDKVGKIETNSAGRKSVTTAVAVDRFAKSDQNGNFTDTFSLSSRQDVDALGNKLFAEYQLIKARGREDDELVKAIQDLEISKSVAPNFVPRLNAMGYNIVK